MKRQSLVLVGLLIISAMSMSWGKVCPPRSKAHVKPAQKAAMKRMHMPTGAGPKAQGGMMGQGDMAKMMQMMTTMRQSIAVDENFIYVIRGNEILKLDKNTLCIIARATIPGMQMEGTSAGAGRGPSMQDAKFDQKFMQRMMRHHAGAIAMSRLAINKAVHPELCQFAQNVINTQSTQDQMFSSWLATWYNTTFQPTLTPVDAETVAKLQNLQGSDFEIAYMRAMILHHAQGVDLAKVATQSAQHPELRAMASDIVNAQCAEIDQLKIWLSNWYGIKD